MTLWMPNKKKPLYAPMLATFGGGSIRGFKGSGGGAPPLPNAPTTTNSNLRFWLFNKSDASTYSNSVTDYNSDITYSTTNVPWSGAVATDFRNGITGGSSGGSVLITGPIMSNAATNLQAFTIEFWYYLDTNASTISPVAFNSSSGGNEYTLLFNYGNGMRTIGTHGLENYDNGSVYFTNLLATGTWRHFMYRYAGNSGSTWIDGSPQLQAQTPSTSTTSWLNTAQMLIGNEADSTPISGSGNLFPGFIADLRVWDRDAYPALATNGTFTPATSYTTHAEMTM